MRSGTWQRIFAAGLGLGALPAHADVVPPQLAVALAAEQAAEARKLDTCSPRRDEEHGRYGRTVIYRQVEYDFRIGEVSADAAELRRVLTSWMAGRLTELRACAPEPSLLSPPERLTATLHLLLQGKTVRSIVGMSGEAAAPRPRLDTACIEKALLQRPELPLRTAAPTGRATVTLQLAPFCVVSREHENPPPATAATYGSARRRHLMPEPTTPPATTRPPPPK